MKNYEHYLNDVEIMKVAHNAASSFRYALSQDEVKSCIMNALLRAIKLYDKTNKAKFTSYLHNGVIFECLNQKKFNKSSQAGQLHINITDSKNNFNEVEIRDLIYSTCDDPELIFDRFFKNMTIKELADSRNVCSETIRIRLDKNMKKIKLSLEKSV